MAPAGDDRRGGAAAATEAPAGPGPFVVDADQLAALLTHVEAAVITYAGDGTITFASPGIRELAGYDPAALVGTNVFDHLHPDDVARKADDLTRWLGRRGATLDANVRIRHAAGGWVEVGLESVNGDPVAPFGAGVATLHRLGPATEVEQELRHRLVNEDRLTRLARTFVSVDRHSFEDGVREALDEMGSLEGVDRIHLWRAAPDGSLHLEYEWRSPALPAILGDVPALSADAFPVLAQLQDLEEVHVADVATLGGDRALEREGFLSRGIRAWYAVPMVEAGRFAGFVAFVSGRPHELVDQSHLSTLRTGAAILAEAFARQRAELRLHHHATHDSLTGLANRWVFNDEVDRLMHELAGEPGAGVAVLLFDLDRFNVVNDSMGHGAGDDLLVAVADRFRSALVADELLARLGGDELVVLLSGVDSAADALHRARELLGCFEAPFTIGATELRVTASSGVAHTGRRLSSAGELLRRADAAMYAAKAAGRRRAVLFDAAIQAEVELRHRYERQLHRALVSGALELHYQPEVDVVSRRVVGVEALLRWRHPDEGLLTAAAFVPVAEDSGAIVEIGWWVLDEALAQLARWAADGEIPADLVLRINLSTRQLVEADLVERVTEALRRAAVDPATVCFEITETALMTDAERSVEVLDKLHALGVQLAIDDFGTGYSSLAQLRRFPIDVLKIDRSFVAGLGQGADDATLIELILSLARTMGLDVTSEGVETEAQLAELARLGCPRAQGFLLARPAPAEAISPLLRA